MDYHTYAWSMVAILGLLIAQIVSGNPGLATETSRQNRNGFEALDVSNQGIVEPVVTYPVEILPRGNRTAFGITTMANGRLHIVALGKDGQIWHVYQHEDGSWENWRQLTTICPSGMNRERPCKFDGDPAIGKNADGRLEIFMRFEENLDLWQMHQIDPHDPSKWSVPREPACVDEDQESGIWYCLGVGRPSNQTYDNYWIISGPAFPTSDVTTVLDPGSKKLQVYFRNFEGHLYYVEQLIAGSSLKYSAPKLLTKDVIFI